MGEWSEVDGRWVWTKDPPAEPPVAQQSLTALAVARTAADVLTANGIIRSPEVVELAAAAGLDLAAAATLLIKESGGGRNTWGSDNVVVAPGTYTKGTPVTQAAYLAYRAAVRAGRAGRQGCGPCQLTFGGYQDQADAAGGCWDWRANVTVGFGILAKSIRTLGLRNGFRAFNGTGPAAEAYATDAMTKYATWQTRLAATPAEDDLTPEQDAKLTAIMEQLSGSTELGKWPGWPTWGGGTGEHLSLVDLARRNNVEVRQAWDAIKAVQAKLDSAPGKTSTATGELSEQDVTRIASAVVGLITTKLANGS